MPLPVFTPLKSAADAQGFRNCLQWSIWPHEMFSSSYNHADDVAQIVDDDETTTTTTTRLEKGRRRRDKTRKKDRDTPPYDDTAQVACKAEPTEEPEPAAKAAKSDEVIG